jgi:hypothetical protein
VVSHEVESTAPPEVAWALVARPARWHDWAPHVRGAWGLRGADGEVRLGARGAARLLGAIPVPAVVIGKVDGRAWTWRVGPVELDHRVEPRAGGGCAVGVDLRAPAPLEAVLRVTYGPLVAALVRNLARAAERAG